MPGIVEFPQVVQDALAQYGDLFANECQRRHFAEYLTGLMVAERKTVLGINREFAQTTDQSCLNRFLTDAAWETDDLNGRRYSGPQELDSPGGLYLLWSSSAQSLLDPGSVDLSRGLVSQRLMGAILIVKPEVSLQARL